MDRDSADAVGSVTERYQTTVPLFVRQALGVSPHCKLEWRIDGRQATVTVRENPGEDEVATRAWLAFLERDIGRGNIVPATKALRDRVGALVAGVEAGDLSQPLDAEPDDP